MEGNIRELPVKMPSFRRSFSARNSITRRITVNFISSHPLHLNSLRRRCGSERNALLDETIDSEVPPISESRVDAIVSEIKKHPRLLELDIEAEKLRRDTLRDLPHGLSVKKAVREQLQGSMQRRGRTRPLSWVKMIKLRLGCIWEKSQYRLHDLIFSVELWYESIHSIEGHFGPAVSSYFYFLRWLFIVNMLLVVVMLAFVVAPQLVYDASGDQMMERIAGEVNSSHQDSFLYYGHYTTTDIDLPFKYNMPLAYFFTVSTLYLVFFVVLCCRTAHSYRRNFIETAGAGGVRPIFGNRLFSGWDFGVTTQQAADLNAHGIYNDFKTLLSEQNRKQAPVSCFAKIGRRLTNIAVTTTVLGLIFGLEYALWNLTDAVGGGSWDLVVTLSVTIVLALAPLVFSIIVRMEYYKPRTALYVTLARIWFLDMGVLMVLLVYWSKSETKCWETSFGREIYRLILWDALISLFIWPSIECFRGVSYNAKSSSTPPDFHITYNSLTLVYNQALLWFGLPFSPLSVVMVAVKLFVLFYVKKECALKACQPARKVWRAAQTQTVLYAMVTLSLFVTLFAIGAFFLRQSSHACGPFRDYEYVYSAVSEGVLGLSHQEGARRTLAFATRPGAIAFLVLTLCVLVYYMRARARAQQSMVGILRHMLVLQAKDRDFLLSAISKNGCTAPGRWMAKRTIVILGSFYKR